MYSASMYSLTLPCKVFCWIRRATLRGGRMATITHAASSVSLLALALFGLRTETAGAQERGLGGAAAGYVATGVSAIATGELDDQLAARGYPTLGRTTAALGVGAYLILPGGVMLGGEWHGLIVG